MEENRDEDIVVVAQPKQGRRRMERDASQPSYVPSRRSPSPDSPSSPLPSQAVLQRAASSKAAKQAAHEEALARARKEYFEDRRRVEEERKRKIREAEGSSEAEPQSPSPKASETESSASDRSNHTSTSLSSADDSSTNAPRRRGQWSKEVIEPQFASEEESNSDTEGAVRPIVPPLALSTVVEEFETERADAQAFVSMMDSLRELYVEDEKEGEDGTDNNDDIAGNEENKPSTPESIVEAEFAQRATNENETGDIPSSSPSSPSPHSAHHILQSRVDTIRSFLIEKMGESSLTRVYRSLSSHLSFSPSTDTYTRTWLRDILASGALSVEQLKYVGLIQQLIQGEEKLREQKQEENEEEEEWWKV